MNALSPIQTVALAATALTSTPSQHGDALLIQLCSEFIARDRQRCRMLDGPDAIADDDEAERAAEQAYAPLKDLLERMSQLRAVTMGGILARTMALAQHAAEMACSFDDETNMTGRLLRLLIRDAQQVARAPHPDAALLALGPALDEVITNSAIANRADGSNDEADSLAYAHQAAMCEQVVTAPPASTAEGLALKAVAVMQELYVAAPGGDVEDRWAWSGLGEFLAWKFLAEIAGPAYRPQAEYLPGAGA